jgi:hypothetical protein
MMKRLFFARAPLCLLWCLGLALLGCGFGEGTNKGSINGISYEVHGGSGVSVEVTNNAIKITSGKKVIEIKDGRIFLNGKDRGPIQSGDSLVVAADSQLSVNGEKR